MKKKGTELREQNGGGSREGKRRKCIPFQDVGWDHIALCDKQAAERVQTGADPQGKALQLHTLNSCNTSTDHQFMKQHKTYKSITFSQKYYVIEFASRNKLCHTSFQFNFTKN